jgi:hypothetical protein
LTRRIRQSTKKVLKTAKQLLEEQESSAGFSNKPATDFGARTDTDDVDIRRSDLTK